MATTREIHIIYRGKPVIYLIEYASIGICIKKEVLELPEGWVNPFIMYERIDPKMPAYKMSSIQSILFSKKHNSKFMDDCYTLISNYNLDRIILNIYVRLYDCIEFPGRGRYNVKIVIQMNDTLDPDVSELEPIYMKL